MDARCISLPACFVQCEHPRWEPLEEVVGLRLASGFMWMHEEELDDGTRIHAYKHVHTRRYLYLTVDGAAHQRLPCGRVAPQRLDLAIQDALCTWWILRGWEAEDRDAVIDAVRRAYESPPSSA